MSEAGAHSTLRPLQERHALVTGAARGIGSGIAEALLLAGAAVTLVDVDPDTADRTARRLANLGTVRTAVCDVSQRDQVDATVAAATAELGPVTVLVNNAQRLRPDVPLVDTSIADLRMTLESGLWGTFHMMQACYPHLSASGGAVINLASSAGLVGQTGLAAYAATKEAIRGLSRVAAREWGPIGITVNVICPAALSPSGQAWADANPDLYKGILQQRAIPRDGDPVSDIGATVAFLAGPGATFISGETITVNGGYPLRP